MVAAEATPTSVEVEFERAVVTAQEIVDVIGEWSRSQVPERDIEDNPAHEDGHADHQHSHGGIFGNAANSSLRHYPVDCS